MYKLYILPIFVIVVRIFSKKSLTYGNIGKNYIQDYLMIRNMSIHRMYHSVFIYN